MRGNKTSARYAKALFQHAMESGKEKEISKDISLIEETLAETNLSFLDNPTISESNKEKVLLTSFTKLSKTTQNFIQLLSKKKRISLISEIAKEYRKFLLAHQGEEYVTLITPVPATDKIKKLTMDILSKIVEKKAVLHNIIDTSLIGGFIIRTSTVQYDASVKTHLKKIKQNI